ncbi:MAG: hypothetical protein HWQ23_25080 [Nostoc sp. JL33]|uniref:hypothetical protein n=1 Tax=Nostoc sp. JL33 TaxID=2815396 RepID=UPI0025D8962C|nr:hypothetical protein [Nostoc sp. JL33]MBN3873419.1 hypothetical protein [Nostoc sp. JL33]
MPAVLASLRTYQSINCGWMIFKEKRPHTTPVQAAAIYKILRGKIGSVMAQSFHRRQYLITSPPVDGFC